MPRIASSEDEDEDEARSVVSSDTGSNAKEEEVVEPVKKSKGRPKKAKVDTPPPEEDEEDAGEGEEGDDDEEEGDEEDEDIFVVEAIVNHVFEEDGNLKFHVRWKDYPKAADHTWEPEENLGTASEVLNEYIESVGGREALAKVPKPKKRGRASTTNGTPASQQKKFKKEASEDVKSETPDKPKLPPGNWEDLVASIDTMDHQVGGLFVLLTFKDGTRVKQPVSTVYKRCPQKMLKFYESHLSIVPATRTAEESTDVLV